MKYAFRFTAAARRQLRSVSGPDAMRLLTALNALGDDPYREGVDVKRLTGTSELYRLRVGNYRIAYQVNDGQLVLLVVEAGNRREVSRNV